MLDDATILKSLYREMEGKEKRSLAEATAFRQHNVVKHVKELPVESPLYPAIMYLDRTDSEPPYTVRWATGNLKGQELTYTEGLDGYIGNQIIYGQDSNHQKVCITDLMTRRSVRHTEGVTVSVPSSCPMLDGVTLGREYISWMLPTKDITRPIEKRCGIIRTKDSSPVFTACPVDYEHYIKAKRFRCWSLKCPDCMNDTALNNGVEVEEKLLAYEGLCRKKGIYVGSLAHFTVSPPQEFFKAAVQTYDTFDAVLSYTELCLRACGAFGGYTVFHPWREKDSYWKFEPHMHMLLYGYIDTDTFKELNPGWVIKKIHAGDEIRSIRHTVAYLNTHMGIGTVTREIGDIQWWHQTMAQFYPFFNNPKAKYTEEDYHLMGEGRGRMCGDLSEKDWVAWDKDRMVRDIRTRYWGEVVNGKLVKVANHREYRIRVCKECGSVLRTYDGVHDCKGDYVRYVADFPVYSMKSDATAAWRFIDRKRKQMHAEGDDFTDLVQLMPTAICTKELDLPENNDIITDSPFIEGDEFFLERQRKAHAVKYGMGENTAEGGLEDDDGFVNKPSSADDVSEAPSNNGKSNE